MTSLQTMPDPAKLILTTAVRAIKPKPVLTVSEWADENRVLSSEGSSEHGRWQTKRNPPLREIQDALSEHVKGGKVVFMAPSQFGKTEVGCNFLGYVMAHAKGPMGITLPTERLLQSWTTQKFDPMIESTPSVQATLSARSNRRGDNSAQLKRFLGGLLFFKYAGSVAELKAISMRYGIGDEIDEWVDSKTQGDPVALYEVRFTAFHDYKLYLCSSPTVKDASKIEEQFEGGDQRRYYVACPHCGERQTLKWTNLRWRFNKKTNQVERVWYACEHSGCEIDEHHKTDMLATGEWIAGAPHNHYRSYHINALYSPIGLGKSWAELVYLWLDAQSDVKKLMVFINTRLAEPFADKTSDIKSNVLKERAEPYALRTVPMGALVVTAGVDTQDDRLEIQVTGHGMGDKTWPIDYHVIPGNPAHDELWTALAKYLKEAKFTNHFGKSLRIEATAIDTGGHHTHAVYNFVRNAGKHGLMRVMACKGASTYGRPILGRPSMQDVNHKGQLVKKGVALYMIGADTGKHLLYNRLHGDADKDISERKVHFSDQLEDSYFEGLVSEKYNPRKNRWELPPSKRNEQLDTWILSVAASMHPEIYLHKWKKSDWQRRAAMIEPSEESKPPAPVETVRDGVEVIDIKEPKTTGGVKRGRKPRRSKRPY